MNADRWGIDQPPAPAPRTLAPLVLDRGPGRPGPARASEWPEISLLRKHGWILMHGAPLYGLLPAAWPSAHRTWVPDRRWTELAARSDSWSSGLESEHRELQAEADLVGLSTPPIGRLWLVRSPWIRVSVSAIYELLATEMDQRRDAGATYDAALRVFDWAQDAALAALSKDTRDLLDAWAVRGRVGDAAHEVIWAEVGPDELAAATAATGLDETALLRWSDLINRPIDDDLVDFVVRWLRAGLPANPPIDELDIEVDMDPNTLQRWIHRPVDE